jgi:hypothetical protein
VTTNSATHLSLADSSVLTSVRGWPSWAVVLLTVGLTFAGTAVDGLTTGALSWGLRIGFYLGVVLAALLVRRASSASWLAAGCSPMPVGCTGPR